jgi:uncharacterized protein (TIGR03437 family)
MNGITPPATSYIEVDGATGFLQEVLVSFVDAPTAPSRVTASPASVKLSSPGPAQATVAVNTADKSQQWTVAVYPANRMAGWLTVTPTSGTGPGTITLTAKGDGYGPGAYPATLVISSPTSIPQTVTVPVMFVLGAGGSDTTITSLGNSATGTGNGAPGGLLSIFGTGLAKTTAIASVPSGIPSSLGGVSAAVNGIAAPVLYVSPTQVNVQVPYEVGAGPAVIGLTNEGGVVGAQFQMAPAAPGIFVDANGTVAPQGEVLPGSVASLYLTGAGEVSLGLATGFATSPTTPLASGPKPLLPLSVTVDGAQAFVQTAGVAPGQVGVVQVNYVAPAGLAPGKHAVVVTIGGTASGAAYVTVR